jgi:signal transduction histidine kinase
MEGSVTCSEMVVPITVKEKVIGVLDVQSDRLNAFDETDLAVIQSLAFQAGAAIENAQLYQKAQHLAVMEERSRLARELHDAVTQTLFSASLIAEAVPVVWEKNSIEGRKLLLELRSLSRGALAEMRTLLLELRPAALVETRFEDLLRQLGEAASGREGIPIKVIVEGEGNLPAEVHVSLYRIAQEALNNVVKHARASQVNIQLRYTCADQEADPKAAQHQSVMLSIRDNGRGFDLTQAPHDRLGLGIMQERAQDIGATFCIESHPGEGTQVTVLWDLTTR